MAVDPVTLGINLAIIIGAVLLAVFILIAIITTWTGVSIGVWGFRRKSAEDAERRRKFRPDGTPYPPASRGLCDGCQRVHETVYHLPSGERRCPACYESMLKEAS